MKIAIFTIALILSFTTVNSQNINEYKYIIIPESFGFLDEPNEYQLNALTKFLFEKNNFSTLMKSEQKPSDIKANGCLGLYADVKKDSNLFVTKLTVLLEDCNGEVVFRSTEGTSREKDYKGAYHDALRDAFTSFEDLDYQYYEKSANASAEEVMSSAVVKPGKVAVESPEDDMRAVLKKEQENKKIEVVGTKTDKESEAYYLLDNAIYFLEESASGYSLFQKGMAEPFASLIKSEGQESFIYSSITKQGLAYFDNEGNLAVEHFDRNNNQMVKTVYRVQD